MSSMNTDLVRGGWLLKCGKTTLFKMSLSYFSPVSLPCAVTSSGLQSQQAASYYHNGSTTKWDGLYNVLGCIGCVWLPTNQSCTIRHMQEKLAFIRPMDLSPRWQIPGFTCLAPCQAGCIVFWGENRVSYRSPGFLTCSKKLVPDSSCG